MNEREYRVLARVGKQPIESRRFLRSHGLVRVVFLGLTVVVIAACSTPAQPRTSHPVPFREFKEIGAVVDASRGFPVAFFAVPGRAPEIVDVDGQQLYAADWTVHIAKRMNQALALVGLYDMRFMQSGQLIFRDELSTGRYSYPYRSKDMAREMSLMPARLAELRFVSAKPVAVGGEAGVQLVLEVSLFSRKHLYSFEAIGGHWDVECFVGIARKVLSDAKFWRAVKTSP